jgi:acyl carrier protein
LVDFPGSLELPQFFPQSTMPASGNLPSTILDLICSEVIQPGRALTVEDNLFEAGLDSMGIMQLLLALEERCGAAIPMSDVTTANFQTAEAIARLVEMRKSAGA